MNVAAVFAGGIGSRFGSGTVPKQFLTIHGIPVIAHTLGHFQRHESIDAIVVAILPSGRGRLEEIIEEYRFSKVKWIVDGGATGQLSRQAALEALALECDGDTTVLMHDGVRPLIDSDLIAESIRCVEEHGTAITCTKFNETIVKSRDGVIDDVVPRDDVYVARAPQCLDLRTGIDIYRQAAQDGEYDSIDTCSLLSRYGHVVHRVQGRATNIKITTAEDFYVCRALFDYIESLQIGS